MEYGAADLTRSYLVSAGIGTDPSAGGNWPVTVAREPSVPDNAITCYDTTGIDHGRSQPTGEAMQSRGVQIRVRSSDYPTGFDKARDVRAALESALNEVVTPLGGSSPADTYLVRCYARITDVTSLGREPATSRYLFTINAVSPVRRV